MPRPRHSHPTTLILLASLALLLSGCFQQPPQERHFVPGDSLHDQWSSSGHRLVMHAGDQPFMKLRLRDHQWRVYDDAFIPAGFLRRHGESRIEVIGPDGQPVDCIDLDHPGRIALDGHFEFTEASQRWTLYLADDPQQPIAHLRRSDDQWQLSSPSSDTALHVHRGDLRPRIDRPSDPPLLLSSPHLSDPAALILTIDALPPLPRAALAMAIDDHPSFSDPH